MLSFIIIHDRIILLRGVHKISLPTPFYWDACTKQWQWTVMYLCVMCLECFHVKNTKPIYICQYIFEQILLFLKPWWLLETCWWFRFLFAYFHTKLLIRRPLNCPKVNCKSSLFPQLPPSWDSPWRGATSRPGTAYLSGESEFTSGF